jgi:hypothetical protein
MDISAPPTMMPSVSLTVDLLPLLLIIALMVCSISVVVGIKRRATSTHSIFLALGGSASAIGLLLILMRSSLPPFASILLGNWLLLSGEALVACGASRYIGRKPTLDAGVGLLSLALFSIAYSLDADVFARVTIYTLACAFFSMRAASGFFQARRSWINWGAGIIASCLCVIELSRAAFVYGNILAPGDKATINGVSMLIGVPLTMLVAGAVVALHKDYFGELFGRKPIELVPVIETVSEVSPTSPWILKSNRSQLLAPDGKAIRLTGNEYIVLQKLSEQSETVDRLTLNALIGRSTIDPKDRGIDILFSRLRRKCADEGLELPINSLRGRGYVFLGELRLQ